MPEKKVYQRLSVDFLLDAEIETGKYINLLNEAGETVATGELYLVGYEDENGNECTEDGGPVTL